MELLVALFLTCIVVCQTSQFNQPIIQTNYGKIEGFTTTEDSKLLTRFLGVPYAKPPLNELRFMLPEKLEKWDGVLDVKTKTGKTCIGPSPKILIEMKYIPLSGMTWDDFVESEDCLTLNIYYTGDFHNRSMVKPKAVLVFIHGGGFTYGSSWDIEGSILTSAEDVIVVSINYRLAFLGFAHTADGEIPGNMGLHDQTMALKWIQENIGYFGGDKSKVTIFGESAGAMSVFFQLVSPLSEGLFSGAIIESAIMLTTSQDIMNEQTFRLSKSYYGCNDDDSAMLLKCLQSLPVETLDTDDVYFSKTELFQTVVRDGVFFPDDPVEMVKMGQFHKSVNVIVGYNADDEDVFAKYFLKWEEITKDGIELSRALDSLQNILMPYFFFQGINPKSMKAEVIVDILEMEYFRGIENPLEVARTFLDMMNDQSFRSGSILIADAISEHGGNVYLYEFRHRSKKFVLDPELEDNIGLGPGHGEELYYVFGNASKGEGDDRLLSLSIMHSWAELARTGKPKYKLQDGRSLEWRRYTHDKKEYFLFDSPVNEDCMREVSDVMLSRTHLWQTTLPRINLLKEPSDDVQGNSASGRDEL